jgi:hypothetical protein
MQKILRILPAQARKSSPRSKSHGIFSGLEISRPGNFMGALRAQILQCVGTGGWLSERCMHRCRPSNHISVARGRPVFVFYELKD